MLMTKRGPGATQEDPLSKRGGRAPTRRSSVSGVMARVQNEDDPVMRDVLGLPPRPPDATANIAMMGTAGDDEEGPWRTDFEPEKHRRPRVTEPSTPLQMDNEAGRLLRGTAICMAGETTLLAALHLRPLWAHRKKRQTAASLYNSVRRWLSEERKSCSLPIARETRLWGRIFRAQPTGAHARPVELAHLHLSSPPGWRGAKYLSEYDSW